MMQAANTSTSSDATPQVRTWAIAAGLVAPVLLSAAFVVYGFFQGPNYSRSLHTISDMYALTAPAGWSLAWIISACGVMTVAFIWWGLYPALGRNRMAMVCSVLFTLSIYAIGDVFAPLERLGCRLADPGCNEEDQIANVGGLLDSTMSTFGILIFPIAVITVGFTMRSLPRFKRWSTLFTIAGLAFVGWLTVGAYFSRAAGTWERVFAYAGATTLFALAWSVRATRPE